MANGNGYSPADYEPDFYPLEPRLLQRVVWRPPPRPTPDSYRQVDPAGSLQPTPTAQPAPDPLSGPDPTHPGWGSKPGYTPQTPPSNENQPTPPPAADKPPVTPGQYSPTPWGHPQVAGIPRMPGHGGVIGNATPDGTLAPPPASQGNRYWNPVPAQQPFGDQINQYAHAYGVPANLLSNLLRAESGFRADATGPPIPNRPYRAHGIAQFIPPTAATYHLTNPNDPDQSIRAAANYLRDLYNQKGTWAGAVAAYNGAKSIDVSQYRGSPEGRALIANATALDTGLVKAGPLVPPPQNYRPVSYTPPGGMPSMHPDRPPSQWGRDTPDMFSGPGAIPHQREIPGIMQGLAPLLMVGLSLFSKGAALPMLSFYGGYLKASAAKQDKDAKELKTKYQDQLKELKAKMGIEQTAYAGAGGDTTELRKLATEFGDSQLLGLLDNGKDPGPLFQQRDRAFQDVSKTDLAERRELVNEEKFAVEQQKWYLEQQEKAEMDPLKKEDLQKKIDAANAKAKALEKQQHDIQLEQEPDTDSGQAAPAAPEEKPPAEAPAPEAPAAPEASPTAPAAPAPAPEASPAAPSPEAPAAPGPAGGAPPASAPAAPGRGAAATLPPPEAGGPDQIVDAQGKPISPRADVVPADYTGPAPPAATPVAAPGTPSATLPGVAVGGLPPPTIPPDLLKAAGLPLPRLDQDAREVLETGRSKYNRNDPLMVPRNEAVARRAAQMQSYIDHVIATTKPGDIDSAFQKLETVDPGMASVARSVDRGDMAPPSGWQLRTPFYINIQKMVTSLDPEWNATRWVTNYRTKVAYDTGTQGIQVASINRALQHLTILRDAATQLKNTNFPDWNALVNGVKTHFGSDAATNFTTARTAVSRELERAFRGSGGAWGEIQKDLEIANSSGSPQQIAGYTRTVTELLKGQLDALADLYSRGTHTQTTGDALLSPEARAVYHHIMADPLDGKVGEAGGPPTGAAEIEQPRLDETATMPPATMGGPGPAPNVPTENTWQATPEQ